jgi:hypothetical protein
MGGIGDVVVGVMRRGQKDDRKSETQQIYSPSYYVAPECPHRETFHRVIAGLLNKVSGGVQVHIQCIMGTFIGGTPGL